jgi:hypothetical protein
MTDDQSTVVFRAWLDAFNSGSPEQLKAYLETYEPERGSLVDPMMGLRDLTGGFDLIKVEEQGSSHLEALLKERDWDCFARMTLDLEGDEVRSRYQLMLVPRPSGHPAPPRVSFEEAIEALAA